MHLQVKDRLFGRPVPTTVRIVYPDGSTHDLPTDRGGGLVLQNMARGTYTVSALRPGLRDRAEAGALASQFTDIAVVTYLDLAVVDGPAVARSRWRGSACAGPGATARRTGATRADAVAPDGRRRARRADQPVAVEASAGGRRGGRAGDDPMRSAVVAVVVGVVLACTAFPAWAAPAGPPTLQFGPSPGPEAGRGPLPVLAYYYQLVRPVVVEPREDRLSGARAATPATTPSVMRRHVRAAKTAGIDGFIVSWKSTTDNNRRLRALADVARYEQFSLAMIYQGLDFARDPLPVTGSPRTSASPRHLRRRPGVPRPGRPLPIWSGTWEFSHDERRRPWSPFRRIAGSRSPPRRARRLRARRGRGRRQRLLLVVGGSRRFPGFGSGGRWPQAVHRAGASGWRRSRRDSTPASSAAHDVVDRRDGTTLAHQLTRRRSSPTRSG